MKKQLLILVAAILAMASSTPAWAYDFSAVAPSGQTLYYNIVSGHAEVVRPGTGSTYNNYVTGNLVIPASVTYNGTTYPVTTLAAVIGYVTTHATVSISTYGSFSGCSGLTSVTIPNSVTSIGNSAFSGCTGLTSVTIPNSVTSIGNNAFSNVRHIEYYGNATGSPWDAISMNGVTEGDFVYSDATKQVLLAYSGAGGSVVIPSTVETIGTKAFYGCTGLTSVTIPNSVTSIGSSAFSGCRGLTSVTIGNSVTTIGNFAFHGCTGLTSVTIPNSVTSIGNSAFWYVRHIEYYGNATGSPWGAISMNGVTEGDFVYSDATKHNLVGYVGNGGNVIIPSTVETIGTNAFYGCTGLTSVTIPNSVTTIGEGAFSGCTGLTSVTIPNSVTLIGSSAFYNVRHIEYYGSASGRPWRALSMNGITEGDFVYSDATKHHLIRYVGNGGNVTVPNSVILIGSSAFSDCTGLTSVAIPDSVISIGDSAFYSCSGLTSVSIPTNVTSIGDLAFADCTGLTSVAFNADSCVYSGSWNDYYYSDDVNRTVFKGCSNITSFTFGNSVKYIPAFLCLSMSHLTSVTIPNSVTSIGESAFKGCSGLTSVTIPNSVTSIGSSAFSGCTSLTSVTIPSSVTLIGVEAFYGCTGLTSVTIPNSVTSIGTYTFSGCSGLTSVTIPNSVTTIGNSAFSGCTGLTSVTIPNSVTTIGNSAFSDCTGLTSVTIPNSVTSIANSAFEHCSGLTSFTIGSGVTSIGVYALSGCTGLRNIISKAVYPPTASNNTFENVPPYCKLTVPCGSLQYYQVTPLWNTQFPLMEENCNPDGIDDTEIGDVMVYAANGMIYISSTLPTETTIFDITGHQVATFTAEAASIPLPAGVYLVKIGAYPARKVVVIR